MEDTMGNLIVTEFVTLDGVAQAPGGPLRVLDSGFTHGGWQAPLLDQESGGVMFERAARRHGRPPPWPKDLRHLRQLLADRSGGDPVHRPAQRRPRVRRQPYAGRPPRLGGVDAAVAGDFAEGITALKEHHDEVHVIGSLDLVQSLLRFGLVDRMNLWLYPLLLGSGKRVFAGGTVPTALRLTESVTYPNGTLQLAYETAGVPTYGDMTTE